MKVTIITPDTLAFEGENITSVTVPGTLGSFQVLKNHAAIVSTLEDGKVIIETGKEKKEFFIKGGVVEVKDNIISILAEGFQQ